MRGEGCHIVDHEGRRYVLSADGTELMGEETLSGQGGRSFALRFHLHPGVQVSLTHGNQSAILKLANREKVPVVTRGSGTGLSGGSLPSPDCIVLCTVKMNRILEVSEADQLAGRVAHAQPPRHGEASGLQRGRGAFQVGAVLAQLGAGFATNSILLKYSRDAETQADQMGAQILYDAGYDPRGLLEDGQLAAVEPGHLCEGVRRDPPHLRRGPARAAASLHERDLLIQRGGWALRGVRGRRRDAHRR